MGQPLKYNSHVPLNANHIRCALSALFLERYFFATIPPTRQNVASFFGWHTMEIAAIFCWIEVLFEEAIFDQPSNTSISLLIFFCCEPMIPLENKQCFRYLNEIIAEWSFEFLKEINSISFCGNIEEIWTAKSNKKMKTIWSSNYISFQY